ncbi:hypothetical protein [Alkalimonas sp.]|uniref:hypothetical protein n=1 Tax=Alkalimonas sp. TaxID=1872453 RepID=UPI00263BC2A1|nr:hypothetical protein [Alkalimonas sp.]MCC5826857.1 hypothetical protein [Alkalimonas sp.]
MKMRLLRKLTKALLWLIPGILLLALSLYALLLAINWQDEAPSADALLLQSFLQHDAPMADELNGYHFLQEHSDPALLPISDKLRALFAACERTDCHDELTAVSPDLPALIAEHQALLDFYQQLQMFSYWQETPLSHHSQIPSYQPVMHAHRLYLLHIWLKVQAGDVIAARQLLHNDLQFWRVVIRHNQHLLGSMISRGALERYFAFSQMLLASLEPEHQIALAPVGWHAPFSAEELSLERAIAGEWFFSSSYIDEVLAAPFNELGNRFAEQFTMWLLTPFLLPQATANDHATQLLACLGRSQPNDLRWYHWLYNPMGKTLKQDMCSHYQRYSLQELEQHRLDTLARLQNLSFPEQP